MRSPDARARIGDPELGAGDEGAADAPPNDARLRRFTGYSMKATFDAVHEDLVRALGTLQLDVRAFGALVLVVDNPGVRRSRLAQTMRIDRCKVLETVVELESRSLVRVELRCDERPVRGLHATVTGERLCERALRAVAAHEARVLSILDEHELVGLTRSLRLLERAAKGVLG